MNRLSAESPFMESADHSSASTIEMPPTNKRSVEVCGIDDNSGVVEINLDSHNTDSIRHLLKSRHYSFIH